MSDQGSQKHIVLFGDSIFDNAIYAPDSPSVINHLQSLIPLDWKATLIAHDGDVTSDVEEQYSLMPEGVTHMVISVGGNDALMALNVFSLPADTVNNALTILAKVRKDFQRGYRAMLWRGLSYQLPLAVCTIYDAVPGLTPEAQTALSLFNDTITREAAVAGVSVIDLRHVCTEADDYSAISPIEPSMQGGKKIAQAILDCFFDHPPVDGALVTMKVRAFDRTVPVENPKTFKPNNTEMTLPNVLNYDKRFEATLIAQCEGDDVDEQELSIIEIDENTIQVVDSSGFLSDYKYLFGDLFRVKKLSEGRYETIEPVLPSKMSHFTSMTQAAPAAYTKVLHELGGEWECEMGMMFALHVPRDKIHELHKRAGGLTLASNSEIFSGIRKFDEDSA